MSSAPAAPSPTPRVTLFPGGPLAGQGADGPGAHLLRWLRTRAEDLHGWATSHPVKLATEAAVFGFLIGAAPSAWPLTVAAAAATLGANALIGHLERDKAAEEAARARGETPAPDGDLIPEAAETAVLHGAALTRLGVQALEVTKVAAHAAANPIAGAVAAVSLLHAVDDAHDHTERHLPLRTHVAAPTRSPTLSLARPPRPRPRRSAGAA